jgi:hypothetical protein
MKPTRLSKTFEQNESYYVKFLPDIENPSQFLNELQFCSTRGPVLGKRYFSYILRDNEATPVAYGMAIHKALDACLRGYWGTPEGYIIEDALGPNRYFNMYTNDGTLKGYYSNDCKSVITLDKNRAEREDLWFFDDAKLFEPRNPYDIKNGLRLSFKVGSTNASRMQLATFGVMQWHEGTALWDSSESGKQKILDMYKNTPSMKNVIESEKKYIETIGNNGGKYLFGDEAKKFYWDYRQSQKV